MSMRTLIIDDEADARENLQNLLKKYCPTLKLVGSADSAETGLSEIASKSPELIFLDIQMPGGSGLDLLEKLPEINFEVIFVTAFDEFAIKAIKLAALDYLLKPINIEELKGAVERAEKMVETKQAKDRFKVLMENQQKGPKKIALSTFEGVVFVDVDQIVHCQADDAYTTFHLQDGEKIMISGSLKEYENLLGDSQFLRVHQSHLINLDKIKKYVKGSGGHVVMSDDSMIGIARSKKQEFLERIAQHNS